MFAEGPQKLETSRAVPVQTAFNFFWFPSVYTKVTYLIADITVVSEKKRPLSLTGRYKPS